MTIRIDKVYTRAGDSGETGLVGGKRISKADIRVDCYGGVDELNSFMGLLGSQLSEKTKQLAPLILFLQQELFDLGSELASPSGTEYPGMWQATEKHITRLEQLCDHFGTGLQPLQSFILPGGGMVVSLLHVCRSVSRRVERDLVRLQLETKSRGETFNCYVLQYFNRLSDLFFVLSRWALNVQGQTMPLWQQDSDRSLNLVGFSNPK